MFGKPRLLFDNRFEDATPVASSTAADYDVANLGDWRPYTWWKPAILPATVRVACGAPTAADYCLVYGHNLGSLGATLEVRGSNDGWVTSDVLISSISPADDKALLLQFAPVSYTDWGLRITGATAPSIAIAAVGTGFELPRYMPTGFDPLKRKMKGAKNRSSKGHPLGTVFEFEEWSANIRQSNIPQTWVRDQFLPAWESHLRSIPFVLACDPAEHADELYLVSTDGDIDAPHNGGQHCDLSFNVSGVHQ